MKWLIVMLAACGSNDVVAPDAAPRVITTDQSLTLGGVAEGTFEGGAGDSVRIVLTAPAPFDWNVHTHAGGTQIVKQETGVVAVDFTFVPPEQKTWNLTILDNGSVPVTIHVELALSGGMTWSGFDAI